MSTDSERMMLLDRLDRALDAKNKIVQKAKAESEMYLTAGVTTATAGLIGYYESKTGKTTLIDGIPLDFSIAAVGFGLGFFGGLGKQLTPYAYAAGAGGMSVYGYKFGRNMGARQAQVAPGALPMAASGAGLTDAELSRLVQAARGAY